jgi:hypothetical protein
MTQTKHPKYRILFLLLGFTIAACSTSTPNPDGNDNPQPTEVIVPVIETDVDGFTMNANGMLTAINIDPDNAFTRKFSSDPNAVGPKVIITFTNTEFKTLNSSIEKSFVGTFADAEKTSLEIKGTSGNPVAQKVGDSYTKAMTIKNTKVLRPVIFDGFGDKASVQAAWKSITETPKTWTVITEPPYYGLEFKYKKEKWTIKP